MKTFRLRRVLIPAVFMAMLASPVFKNQAYAYVLPSDHLLDSMAANFSKFETLIINHTVERESEEGFRTFEELIAMKGTDWLHAAPREGGKGNDAGVIDRGFWSLFLANTQARLRDLLRGAGVDLGRVSYTRVDGNVAYLLGDRREVSPKLAVEKARFLPLFFQYPSQFTPGSELVRVIFKDFRQVDQGWYPFEIICDSDAGWSERYTTLSIKVNAPVEPSLFHSVQEESLPAERPHENERIEGIIKSLEQKYGR